MFDVDDIRDWRGLPVVDKEGGKIGKLEAVYFDTATEEPTFATVKVGLPGGGRLVFVPLAGARVSPQSVRVMTACCPMRQRFDTRKYTTSAAGTVNEKMGRKNGITFMIICCCELTGELVPCFAWRPWIWRCWITPVTSTNAMSTR